MSDVSYLCKIQIFWLRECFVIRDTGLLGIAGISLRATSLQQGYPVNPSIIEVSAQHC